MMKVTRITENNKTAFNPLFPEGYTAREDRLYFGAVSDKKEAVSAISLGVNDETSVYIDWIYTDSSYRNRGAATELLDTVSAFLQEMDITGLEISYTDGDEGLDDFLKTHGFVTSNESDTYAVPAGDLIYSELMDALMEKIPDTDRVFTMYERDMSDDIARFLEDNDLEPDSLEDIDISERLSLMAYDETDSPTGCMFVSEPDEETVEVLYFLNTGSDNTAMEMVVKLSRALRSYDYAHRTLIFTDRSGNITRLVEHLTDEAIDGYRVDGLRYGVCLL